MYNQRMMTSQPSFAERKKREEAMRKAGRLPGQALTEKFPILLYYSIPPFDPDTREFCRW